MAFVEINPKYRDMLARAGLASASDFLACAGESVCVRPERRVDRVMLSDNLVGYLKKETRILLRERLTSWWGGYGWSSKSVREGIVLGELGREKIGCPTVLALGEDAGQAFVLLREERDLEPLDRFLHCRPDQMSRIARMLGRELARMHAAGFHHPDLFAKHVLVGQADGLDRVCLIDWQRTRRLPMIPWSRRIVDLATLDASLATNAVPERERLRLLASYLHRIPSGRPKLRNLIAAIRSRAWLLLKQRRIRRQNLASLAPMPSLVGPHNWHGWHNCPVRLTEPNLAVLPLVNFLRGRVDVELSRRRLTLRQAGRALRDLHEAGYSPADLNLESWVVHCPAAGEVEILLTSVGDLTPTTVPVARLAIDDLARLLARHGSSLSRADLVCVVRGYLGPTPRPARRDLVRRILDAREPAR